MSFDPSVITVTLNPAIDQTVRVAGFAAGRVNRVAQSRMDAGGKGVNVACFLADLGIQVAATGFLGQDNIKIFDSLFEQKAVNDRFVTLDGPTRVGIKIVDIVTRQTTDLNFPGLTPGNEEIVNLFERSRSWRSRAAGSCSPGASRRGCRTTSMPSSPQ